MQVVSGAHNRSQVPSPARVSYWCLCTFCDFAQPVGCGRRPAYLHLRLVANSQCLAFLIRGGRCRSLKVVARARCVRRARAVRRGNSFIFFSSDAHRPVGTQAVSMRARGRFSYCVLLHVECSEHVRSDERTCCRLHCDLSQTVKSTNCIVCCRGRADSLCDRSAGCAL